MTSGHPPLLQIQPGEERQYLHQRADNEAQCAAQQQDTDQAVGHVNNPGEECGEYREMTELPQPQVGIATWALAPLLDIQRVGVVQQMDNKKCGDEPLPQRLGQRRGKPGQSEHQQ